MLYLLSSKRTFDRIIEYFPQWMDIRKRRRKAAGANYLLSIIEELDEINLALIDYKKDFFAVNYIGREHEVIDYLYIANIGSDSNGFVLIEPDMQITTDIKDFYRNAENKLVYYTQGKLAFKLKPNGVIRYTINDVEYKSEAVKTHIWNIIDEFALFTGLRRYPDETNAELLNRTFHFYKNPINSTENGLKNAIINALVNKAHIFPEDIAIERPTQENIHKLVDGVPIVDHLAEFNQDLFRTKRWGENKWHHDFALIKHEPHVWDEPIEAKQRGVGYNDALKVFLPEEEEIVNAIVDLYRPGTIAVETYLRNNPSFVDIALGLRKFENILNPMSFTYKAKAYPAIRIPEEAFFRTYKADVQKSRFYISNIALNKNSLDVQKITKQDIPTPNKNYSLIFTPTGKHSTMSIDECYIQKRDGEIENLLLAANGYAFNENGGIYNLKNGKLYETVRQLVNTENIEDAAHGISLQKLSAPGSFEVPLDINETPVVHIDHDCAWTSITTNRGIMEISGMGMSASGELQSVEPQSSVQIEFTNGQPFSASIYFEITGGACRIIEKLGDSPGQEIEALEAGDTFEKHYAEQSKVKIIVIRDSANPARLRIANIKYKQYRILCGTQKESMALYTAPINITPGDNRLYCEMQALSTNSPVIKSVYAGADMSTEEYIIPEFFIDQGDRLEISSNCTVKLCNLTDETAIDNFISQAYYRNILDRSVEISIDTNYFLEILSASLDIEKKTQGNATVPFITINPGETIKTIDILGQRVSSSEEIPVHSFLPQGAELFATQADDLIVRNKEQEYFMRFDASMFGNGIYRIEALNLPPLVETIFVIDQETGTQVKQNEYTGYCDSVYFRSFHETEHIAYNTLNIFMPKTKDLPLTMAFDPTIDPGQIMYYVIEQPNNINISALFQVDDGYRAWSLGRKLLTIFAEVDFNNLQELEPLSFESRFAISNYIELPKEVLINDTLVNLSEYIVTPPDKMNVVYNPGQYYKELIIIEEDGFNKLRFSNIERIKSIKNTEGNTLISNKKVTLLKEEGVVLWNGAEEEHTGKRVFVEYLYKAPQYIVYKDIQGLYEAINHHLEAYQKVGTYAFYGLKDGDAIKSFSEDKEARLYVVLSSPGFRAWVDGDNIIHIKKMDLDNAVIINPGYYYDQNQEYYFFASPYEQPVDGYNNILFYNSQKDRQAQAIRLFKSSSNELLNSTMQSIELGQTGVIDPLTVDAFDYKTVIVCNNVYGWYSQNTRKTIQGKYNPVIQIDPYGPGAYSVIEITEYLGFNTVVSLETAGNIDIGLFKHQPIELDGNIYKTEGFLRLQPTEIEKRQEDNYTEFIFDDTKFEHLAKYYLVFQGSGEIRDIVIKDYISEEPIGHIHTKHIDKLGYEIEETIIESDVHKSTFIPEYGVYNNTQVDSHGIIRTAYDVCSGAIILDSYKSKWHTCYLDYAIENKEKIVASIEVDGFIKTRPLYIPSHPDLQGIAVQVNNVLTETLSGFDIKVTGSNLYRGTFKTIAAATKANTVVIKEPTVYISVEVKIPPGKVIEDIQVFALYPDNLSAFSDRKFSGVAETQLFDSGRTGEFRLAKIDIEVLSGSLKNDAIVEIGSFREDDRSRVWEWQEVKFNDSFEVTSNNHFYNNRYFKLRITLNRNIAIRIGDIYVRKMEEQ